MIYLKEYNLIYIKSRKTASTLTEFLIWQLVEKTLPKDLHKTIEINGSIKAHNDGLAEGELKELFKKNKKINFAHMTLTEVKDYFGENFFNRAFKVSTIRNPYVQLVSEFIHLLTRNELPKDFQNEINKNLTQYKTNKDFKKEVFLEFLENRAMLNLIRDQLKFFFINDVYQLNSLIRQEKISEDLTTLFEEIGVKESLKNEVLVLTKKGINRAKENYIFYEFLNNESLKLINQNHKELFKIGGYEMVDTKKDLFDLLKKQKQLLSS